MMTLKTTFSKQINAPKEEKSVDQAATFTSVNGKSKIDTRDIVRTRIEILLEWAQQESSHFSLTNPLNN